MVQSENAFGRERGDVEVPKAARAPGEEVVQRLVLLEVLSSEAARERECRRGRGDGGGREVRIAGAKAEGIGDGGVGVRGFTLGGFRGRGEGPEGPEERAVDDGEREFHTAIELDSADLRVAGEDGGEKAVKELESEVPVRNGGLELVKEKRGVGRWRPLMVISIC